LKETIRDKEGIPIEEQSIYREGHIYLGNEKVYSGKNGELEKHFNLNLRLCGSGKKSCSSCEDNFNEAINKTKFFVSVYDYIVKDKKQVFMLSPESYIRMKDTHKNHSNGEKHEFCPICGQIFDSERADKILKSHLQSKKHGLSEDEALLYWETVQKYKYKESVIGHNTHPKRKMDPMEKEEKKRKKKKTKTRIKKNLSIMWRILFLTSLRKKW